MTQNNAVGPEPSVQGYLDRIGYRGPLDASAATLSALQEAHVHSIPFENLDILRGRSPSLDIGDLYDKIVVRRRGGYCFELNGLFAWLLRQSGYQVTEYNGRFLLGEAAAIPMRRHRICRAEAEGKPYLCDVGVGLPTPRRPLRIVEELEQGQGEETYRLIRDPALGWIVQTLQKGKWSSLYSFTEEPQYPIDYEMPNHWCATHPDSIFVKNTMVHIRTREGRNTIADVVLESGRKAREFRIFTRDGVRSFIPGTPKEFDEALRQYFGITLD